MSVAVGGNVLVFPGSQVGGKADADEGNLADAGGSDDPGNAFLEALQASVSSAEELIEATEASPDTQELPAEDSSENYSGWVDYAFFGTLFDRVEAKVQEACKNIAVASGEGVSADPAIDVERAGARVIALRGRAVPGSGEDPSTIFNLVESGDLPAQIKASQTSAQTTVIPFDPSLGRARNAPPTAGGQPQALVAAEHAEATSADHVASIDADKRALSRLLSERLVGERRAETESRMERRATDETRLPSSGKTDSAVSTGTPLAMTPPIAGAVPSPAAQIAHNILQSSPVLMRPVFNGLTETAKSFRFKLQPETLGEVGVSMKLQGNKMILVLSADETAAKELLEADKEKLKAALSGSNTGVDVVEVSVVLSTGETTASRDAGRPQAEPAQFGQQAQQNLAGGQSNGSQRQYATQSQWTREFQHDDGTAAALRPARDGSADRRAGIYL